MCALEKAIGKLTPVFSSRLSPAKFHVPRRK
jgi:hypothetical protein